MGARVVVGLGANLGEALATLQAAVGEIAALDGVTRARGVARVPHGAGRRAPTSPTTTTRRCCSSVERAPLELLRALQAHRARPRPRAPVRWGPRTLDLDILLWGEGRSTSPTSPCRTRAWSSAASRWSRCSRSLPDADPAGRAPPGRRLQASPEQGVERVADATIGVDLPPDGGEQRVPSRGPRGVRRRARARAQAGVRDGLRAVPLLRAHAGGDLPLQRARSQDSSTSPPTRSSI